MHELTECDLYQVLEYAKSTEENAGRKIIEHSSANKPVWRKLPLAFPRLLLWSACLAIYLALAEETNIIKDYSQ